MSDQRSFLFLLGSARRDGNTEALARAAAAHLPAGTAQEWLHLADLPLAPFTDRRHTGESFPQPEGNEQRLLSATLAATDVVIASPLYWYSVSAPTKLYLDYWSAWLRVPGADFRARMGGKTMWAVSALSSSDATTADALVGTLRLSARYLGMNWGGTLLGNGSRPGDVDSDPEAQTAAKTFFH
ncbi:NAD(P)H-dependent oxidoreductase [Catellatospora sp. KI3]|uniref:flavodoxin family protein n=1 Tax=Catellatospora sp. KI3 TaxID=3041620 RepID=UPI0024828AA0|nr:NAD(P)H-dependent oxidoreductase [Catellatospora sp. KI3]MDI1459624.1 NAD(P)H-dependent oxidoreductase [Catellatospora sp. KI3]